MSLETAILILACAQVAAGGAVLTAVIVNASRVSSVNEHLKAMVTALSGVSEPLMEAGWRKSVVAAATFCTSCGKPMIQFTDSSVPDCDVPDCEVLSGAASGSPDADRDTSGLNAPLTVR